MHLFKLDSNMESIKLSFQLFVHITLAFLLQIHKPDYLDQQYLGEALNWNNGPETTWIRSQRSMVKIHPNYSRLASNVRATQQNN